MDQPVVGYLHESIRLYRLCQFMDWSHLPVEGGLYAQDPQFLDDVLEIGSIEGQAQKRKQALEKRKAGRK